MYCQNLPRDLVRDQFLVSFVHDKELCTFANDLFVCLGAHNTFVENIIEASKIV